MKKETKLVSTRKPLLVGVLLFILTFLQNCETFDRSEKIVLEETSKFANAYNPPKVRSFPSDAPVINDWIAKLDNKKIRAHAWDIWQSINTMAADSLPIWQNWFSGYEVFNAPTSLEEREMLKDFEFPSQFFHGTHIKAIPENPAERPTSFNKFSPSLAKFIFDHRYFSAKVLDSINRSFSKGTSIADRQISTSKDSIDKNSFALKPVFQFIKGDTITAIPYWTGVTAQTTTNFLNPTPSTWRQCVVVDPSGKLAPGSSVTISCNGEAPKAWPVVSLKEFYAFLITETEAKAFSDFAKTSGDEVGRHNQSDSVSVGDMVKAGNYALLMAMHVTGKEIVNWTWQTFWWSPDKDNPVFGADRPKSISKPWSNYNMRPAYYMVSPANVVTNGEPNIQFNPYLETNLSGTLAKQVGYGDTSKPITWYGVFSNCMSCHRAAAYDKLNNASYLPNGFINPADSLIFKGNTKTDFLWSIPTRAH